MDAKEKPTSTQQITFQVSTADPEAGSALQGSHAIAISDVDGSDVEVRRPRVVSSRVVFARHTEPVFYGRYITPRTCSTLEDSSPQRTKSYSPLVFHDLSISGLEIALPLHLVATMKWRWFQIQKGWRMRGSQLRMDAIQ